MDKQKESIFPKGLFSQGGRKFQKQFRRFSAYVDKFSMNSEQSIRSNIPKKKKTKKAKVAEKKPVVKDDDITLTE